MIPEPVIDEDVKRWIKEDISYWDITTSLIPNVSSTAIIYAKQDGIIAGIPVVKRIFEIFGASFNPLVEEGARVAKKTKIALIEGKIHALLQAERVALNIFGRMSGIATATAEMIEKATEVNPNIRICATRKVAPGLSRYDKYAVMVGGGDTHRFNLSDMILLKENHLAFFDSITQAIEEAKQRTSFSKKIEIEVKNEEEALEAAKAAPDIIMLDNFSPQQAKHVIKKIKAINDKVLIELSGNIRANNLTDYPLELVDLVSSGAITHSAKSFDLSMLIKEI